MSQGLGHCAACFSGLPNARPWFKHGRARDISEAGILFGLSRMVGSDSGMRNHVQSNNCIKLACGRRSRHVQASVVLCVECIDFISAGLLSSPLLFSTNKPVVPGR